jgi:hypothetical protein
MTEGAETAPSGASRDQRLCPPWPDGAGADRCAGGLGAGRGACIRGGAETGLCRGAGGAWNCGVWTCGAGWKLLNDSTRGGVCTRGGGWWIFGASNCRAFGCDGVWTRGAGWFFGASNCRDCGLGCGCGGVWTRGAGWWFFGTSTER